MHEFDILDASEHTVKVLYCALNSITGKAYIGITTTSLYRRKIAHKHAAKLKKDHFHSAINKHGWGAFEWLILHVAQDKTELLSKEREFISKHRTNDRLRGYNTTEGGEFPSLTEEVKLKIGLANSGRFGHLNPFFGKKHSKETREKWSLLRRGKIPNNGFTKHTPETKKNLSDIRKKWAADPVNKKRLSLNNQHRIPVTRLETGQVFNSLKEAVAELPISYTYAKVLFKKGLTISGFNFQRVESSKTA